MSMYSHKINPLTGSGDVLGAQQGKVTLLVNVASKCGLTPQYTVTDDEVKLGAWRPCADVVLLMTVFLACMLADVG